MNTTIPASFAPTSSIATCPYECVRLGLGLRFRDAARLAYLVLATALLALACEAPVQAPASDEPTPAPVVAWPALNATVAVPVTFSAEDNSGVAVACDMWREASGGAVDLHPFIGGYGDITVVAGPLEDDVAGRMSMDSLSGRPVITLDLAQIALVASRRGSFGYIPTAAGVMAHELGHALGLGHALEGIMTSVYWPRGAPIDPVTVSDLADLRGFEAPAFDTCRDGSGFVFASESVPGTSCQRLSSSSANTEWCCPL